MDLVDDTQSTGMNSRTGQLGEGKTPEKYMETTAVVTAPETRYLGLAESTRCTLMDTTKDRYPGRRGGHWGRDTAITWTDSGHYP